MKKGISLISGVLFLAITISAAAVVYNIGMPIIEKMQATATVNEMKTTFTVLDKEIQEIASEGKGSKRVFNLRLSDGELTVNSTKDWIMWTYETTSPVLSPRTAQWIGNVIIGSNLEAKAYESTHNGDACYVLENEHLKVYINKTGNSSSLREIETRNIVLDIWQKDLKTLMPLDSINITLDNDPSSAQGNGYVTLSKAGENLPYATAYALINSSYERYYINFTLESGADWIKIEGVMS